MEVFENEYVHLEYHDNILFTSFVQENTIITLDLAKKVVDDRIAFTKGENHLMCLRAAKFSYAGKEVRDFMKIEGVKNVLAGVFIVNNAVTSVFFQFLH